MKDNTMSYVFLQNTAFGGAIIFAKVGSDKVKDWANTKTLTLIKPLILVQQMTPKQEMVNKVSVFPTRGLPVVDKDEIEIQTINIVWIKEVSILNAEDKEKKLIEDLTGMQVQAYSSLTLVK